MARTPSLLWLVLLVGSILGCDRGTPVGLPCTVGAAGAPSQTVIVDSLECAGRLCMEIGQSPARCTARCTSEEDCAGQSAGPSPCRSGFVCAVATWGGPEACQRVCTCRDDVPLGWSDSSAVCHGG